MVKERKGMVISSALAALLVAGLMINAYVTKPKQHIGMGGGGEAAVGGQQGLSTPQVIAEGLNITKRLEKALAAKNITTATDAAEKLDSTLDPLKDAIADRNPSLVNTLATDSLIDTLKNAKPDFTRATALTDTMEKGLQQAKTLFPPPSTVDRINADLNLVGQIKAAIGAHDFKTALDEAATLDENVDPLKDAIQDKAPDLINALNVEALTDNLEEANPDSGEIDSSLDAMTAALNRAKTLFSQDQSKEGG